MKQDEVTQIRIGNSAVGIIGLKAVMEEVDQEYGDKTDREVQEELLNRLCRRNYIPEKVKESYAKALMREFKKFLGKPFEEESLEGIQIKVLGSGCVKCDQLEQELMQVMAETGIVADMEHVRDIKEIGRYGVMGTPALLINGHVKSIGKVPPKVNLIEWLKEADEKEQENKNV
jgi:small redox-active disulfide protein 2